MMKLQKSNPKHVKQPPLKKKEKHQTHIQNLPNDRNHFTSPKRNTNPAADNLVVSNEDTKFTGLACMLTLKYGWSWPRDKVFKVLRPLPNC